MNYHQIGTALHKEYEAKYSVSTDIHDQAVDSNKQTLKLFSTVSVTIVGIVLTIISLLV